MLMAEGTPMVWESAKVSLQNSFQQALDQVILYGPKVIAAIVVVVVGYVVARAIGKVLTKVSEKLGLQIATERSGLAQSMRHMGIERNVPTILGTIGFWLLMCVFFMAAFNILGLTEVSAAMSSVAQYIPNLLVATVIVVVGLFAATFLRGVIATSTDRLGISYAEHLANGCYYTLALLTFILTLKHLGIEFQLLNYMILLVCGGLALGFGLALGLGGRDVMAGILAGYYLRQRLASGDSVEVGGLQGTVREVGPVATVIETDEHGLINRHTVPNTKMLNEAVR
ncbi:MAG: mechanosensitive ion channel domain-containing protein [Thermoguttaceae bacterium]